MMKVMIKRIYFLILFSISIDVSGFEMYMDSLQSTSGSQISMPVYVNGFTDITSIQGSIIFDASVISYFNVSNFNLPGLTVSNFGTNQTGLGILTYSWYDASLQGVTVTDSTQLFSIDFTVVGSAGQSSSISFSNSPTILEVVDIISNLPTLNLVNGFVTISPISSIEERLVNLFVYPNIVRVNQEVHIKGKKIVESIVVFDINGRVINNYNLKINKIQFLQNGLFFLLIDGHILKCLVI